MHTLSSILISENLLTTLYYVSASFCPFSFINTTLAVSAQTYATQVTAPVLPNRGEDLQRDFARSKVRARWRRI